MTRNQLGITPDDKFEQSKIHSEANDSKEKK